MKHIFFVMFTLLIRTQKKNENLLNPLSNKHICFVYLSKPNLSKTGLRKPPIKVL
jgi:hypothetical protein